MWLHSDAIDWLIDDSNIQGQDPSFQKFEDCVAPNNAGPQKNKCEKAREI